MALIIQANILHWTRSQLLQLCGQLYLMKKSTRAGTRDASECRLARVICHFEISWVSDAVLTWLCHNIIAAF
jgi:hypothetical protein